MFQRALMTVLCLISTPCFAEIVITEDTTLHSIPDDYVLVFGDATLTLAKGPNGEIPSTYSIRLVDAASLVMESGDVGLISFERPWLCEYEERCQNTHRASISNSRVGGILIDSTVLADITLNDTSFQTLSGSRPSVISINYSDTFDAIGRGALHSTNYGHLSFTAPGASYIQPFDKLEFLYTNPAGIQESPFFISKDDMGWLFEAGRVSIEPTGPVVPGDADGDGQVGVADLNAVRNNFGRLLARGATALGDTVPYDFTVDVNDLNIVRNNFGASLSQSVPEPSSMALACIALAGILGRYRYRLALQSKCQFL